MTVTVIEPGKLAIFPDREEPPAVITTAGP